MKYYIINLGLTTTLISFMAHFTGDKFIVAGFSAVLTVVGFGISLLGLCLKLCCNAYDFKFSKFYIYQLLATNYQNMMIHTALFAGIAVVTAGVNFAYIESAYEQTIGEPYPY